jgi:hypothetical protein
MQPCPVQVRAKSHICGTFYCVWSILDGFSRYVVHGEVRPSMTDADVEIILRRARERFPDARPRLISDNGPQFVARDFKEFIALAGMTHVRTSPYDPQSNGKLERYHRAPADKLAGRAEAILAVRQAKLAAAREARRRRRRQQTPPAPCSAPGTSPRRDVAGAGATRHRLGIGGSPAPSAGDGGTAPAGWTPRTTLDLPHPLDENASRDRNPPPDGQAAMLLIGQGPLSNAG